MRMMAGRGSYEVGSMRMMDGKESCEDDGWWREL
jgi:hypothetical protein